MNFWVAADWHFGHEKMREYCNRPSGYEYEILRNIVQKVAPNDVLIFLGDFCIGRDEYWHEQFMEACKGKRWLLRGNHDSKSPTWYMTHGWDFVGDRVQLDAYGTKVILTHRPIDEAGEYINVHGHHHNTLHHPEDQVDYRHRLVVSEHAYTPLRLRQVLKV